MKQVLALLAAIGVTWQGSQAVAATPLPAPANLHATHVSDTSADLDWLRDGATATDVVQRLVNGVWQEWARTNSGFLSLTNLTPGTTYTFRVYLIPVSGLGYSTSPPSAPLSFTTLSGPDTVPPAKPAAPTFSTITTTAVNVFWPETTDNVQVTGYWLQQFSGGAWSTIRTVGPGGRFQTVYGLSANTTYTFAVIAFDARGNTSPRSDPGTVTTLAHTANVTCSVQLIVFGLNYTAYVTVINTTPAPISGWAIRFTVPLSTSAGNAFNGTLTRNGTDGTVTPAVWYATINPGTQATFGFFGTSAGPVFQGPASFTAYNAPCTTT
ncbi:MAG TPA: cellulose binding domain-containing protein [Candidatus Limnocylindrales bacterium]|nr:cellulose binding domain-containing protein [Candidatus Limnocylindrales bacterium]